jgi:hypothetical protein
MSSLMEVIRADVARYWQECLVLAVENCRICRGTGQTTGYIAPGKYAQYPCPCTGRRL